MHRSVLLLDGVDPAGGDAAGVGGHRARDAFGVALVRAGATVRRYLDRAGYQVLAPVADGQPGRGLAARGGLHDALRLLPALVGRAGPVRRLLADLAPEPAADLAEDGQLHGVVEVGHPGRLGDVDDRVAVAVALVPVAVAVGTQRHLDPGGTAHRGQRGGLRGRAGQ